MIAKDVTKKKKQTEKSIRNMWIHTLDDYKIWKIHYYLYLFRNRQVNHVNRSNTFKLSTPAVRCKSKKKKYILGIIEPRIMTSCRIKYRECAHKHELTHFLHFSHFFFLIRFRFLSFCVPTRAHSSAPFQPSVTLRQLKRRQLFDWLTGWIISMAYLFEGKLHEDIKWKEWRRHLSMKQNEMWIFFYCIYARDDASTWRIK